MDTVDDSPALSKKQQRDAQRLADYRDAREAARCPSLCSLGAACVPLSTPCRENPPRRRLDRAHALRAHGGDAQGEEQAPRSAAPLDVWLAAVDQAPMLKTPKHPTPDFGQVFGQ